MDKPNSRPYEEKFGIQRKRIYRNAGIVEGPTKAKSCVDGTKKGEAGNQNT
jgi:hypothetical protein